MWRCRCGMWRYRCGMWRCTRSLDTTDEPVQRYTRMLEEVWTEREKEGEREGSRERGREREAETVERTDVLGKVKKYFV